MSTLLAALDCHQVGDIVVPCSLQVGLDAQFVVVLQLHGSIGVEALPQVMHGLLQLARTLPLLYYKHLRQFFLQLQLVLVTSRFFLYMQGSTLLPPTLGIT